MKIAILSIGNELLSGDTINTNAGWMGRNLTDIGCDICRQITVPDKKDSISNALTELVNLNPGYIFVPVDWDRQMMILLDRRYSILWELNQNLIKTIGSHYLSDLIVLESKFPNPIETRLSFLWMAM